MDVTWRPHNYGGENVTCSLLTLIWAFRQFGSVCLARACPADLRILSLYCGVGTTYKALGVNIPSAIVPASEDDVVALFTDRVSEPILEQSDWIGHAPASKKMQLGRETLLLVVIGFFVALGSGSSSWLAISLCLSVLPAQTKYTMQGEELPWAKLSISGLAQSVRGTWFVGTNKLKPYGGTTVPPPFYIMAAAIAASMLARSHLHSWRAGLGFNVFVLPAEWIKWTMFGLVVIAACAQMKWWYDVNGGLPMRHESRIAVRTSIVIGSVTTVLCLLRFAKVVPHWTRWIAEGLLWLTTAPLFVLYPDGPSGNREGARRLLYLWQWMLAGAVSMM